MHRQQATVGALQPAIAHFLKAARGYWPGPFVGYAAPALPRTHNDREQCCGAVRYQERRATGRKLAAPALVVRGSARPAAAAATRAHPFTAEQLRPLRRADWRHLRRDPAQRQETRRAQARFRRHPAAYLAQAEALLLQPGLPP